MNKTVAVHTHIEKRAIANTGFEPVLTGPEPVALPLG